MQVYANIIYWNYYDFLQIYQNILISEFAMTINNTFVSLWLDNISNSRIQLVYLLQRDTYKAIAIVIDFEPHWVS